MCYPVYVCLMRSEVKYIVFCVLAALCGVVCLWLLVILLVTRCVRRESCLTFKIFSAILLYIDTCKEQVDAFLGAFAKLRKVTISFVMSVRTGTSRLVLDRFS